MNFMHPEFLAVAAALVSVPIIIHLINRLRFKRIAWAAMEFLFKAQKKNRRRLIIEQLLLLALRCFLVALVGLLVMRFRANSFSDLGVAQSIHIVLVDDSLSMTDRWKKTGSKKLDGNTNCFEEARDEILIGKIATKLYQANSPEDLIVLPLSECQADFVSDKKAKTYQLSGSSSEFEEFKKKMAELEPTKLHLNLLDGVKAARKIADDNPKALVTFTLLSDFRKKDFDSDSATLHKELVEFSRQRKAKIHLVDTLLDPARTPTLGVAPPGHDNIGIVDLRPRSRMVGRDMPVTFTLSVANFGPQRDDIMVAIYEQNTGRPCQEVNFMPALPLKLKSKEITQVTFELRIPAPDLGDNESQFFGISAHLEGPNLDKDGLQQDNVGHGVVEVRKQVPILIVDGEGKAGYDDDLKGRDSFFLDQAFRSVPGQSRTSEEEEGGPEPMRPFRVDFPYKPSKAKDKLDKVELDAMSDPMKALERGDLRQYPAIILCNVPKLSKPQIDNLEKFVAEGGGLGIFLGPLVSAEDYNKNLYRDGQGVFPVQLKDTYFPSAAKDKLKPQYIKGVPMLQLRDDNPTLRPLPIFGTIFTTPAQREWLDLLPVYRYFKVESRPWAEKDKKGSRVQELATLANDNPVEIYAEPVMDIVRRRETPPKTCRLEDLLDRDEYRKYRKAFDPYRTSLEDIIKKFDNSPYILALELERMLKDRGTGKDSTNLEEFWSIADPQVQSLRAEVKKLHDRVRYGDGAPFIVTSPFGKGKVVVVMSTAGELWSGWCGGNPSSNVYQPFIWEMQNYLSAQSGDVNLTLGKTPDVNIDTQSFTPNRPIRVVRTQMKEIKEKPAQRLPAGPVRDFSDFGKTLTLSYPRTTEPGVYLTEVFYNDGKGNDGKDLDASPDTKAKDDKTKDDKSKDDKAKDDKLKDDKAPDGKDDKVGQPAKDKAKEPDTLRKKPGPIYTSATVFNIDTVREGNLERVTYDVIKVNVLDKGEKRIDFSGQDVPEGGFVQSLKDLSESPLLFLLFLSILVAEQALAVHLSFHLKGNETFTPAQSRPLSAR
jgi:hypothetical protein